MDKKQLKSFYAGKTVLVTGSTGFKGSWLCRILLHFGARVVGIGLAPATTPSLFTELGLDHRIRQYNADVRYIDAVRNVMEATQPEIIFHLAAQPLVRKSYREPLETMTTNVLGTVNVLEVARMLESLKSLVVITTDKVYENREWVYPYREHDRLGGHDPYSGSKAAADIVTQTYIHSYFSKEGAARVAIARAGNVIGGGDWSEDRLIPDIVRALYEGDGKVVVRNPDAVRPWEHVLEPLSGYLMLAQKLAEDGHSHPRSLPIALNFGPDTHSFVPVGQLVQDALKRAGSGSLEIRTEAGAVHEAGLLMLDVSLARVKLGWKPTWDYVATIDRTIMWYAHYYQYCSYPGMVDACTLDQIEAFFS